MIAQVIVNHPSKEVDRLYDYLIPEELEDKICVGNRVLVPFGRGNRLKEAYVFKVNRKSRAKNLKRIISIDDGGRVFDEQMLQLICYLREKCLCSYIDVIRAVIPTGTGIKPEEWIVLKREGTDGLKSEIKKEIISILHNNGGACEINYFMQFFDCNVKTQISAMCADGILQREYRDGSRVHDKQIRAAFLAVDESDALRAVEEMNKKRAYAQAKMLEILVGNEFIAVSDLVKFSDGSYNSVSSLEKKGLIYLENITVMRDPIKKTGEKLSKPPKFTEEQEYAAKRIKEYIDKKEHGKILLHGVTGSGKTEVFMNVIDETVKRGRQAILLVPEISLTPQTVRRFVSRFGDRVAVFHSGLSMGEKYDQWKRMRDKDADIAIGARSAVFAPFDNIGIIIMDEEHEQSYKSEMIPRYSAKEAAEFRAALNNAVLLLASATPDVGDYYRAETGEYELISMTKRAAAAVMPQVDVVDMRNELESGNKSIFSKKLSEEIEKNLKRKEQTILFLNRRGFSTFVSCRSCGYVARCPECNISLTYHKYNNTLRCHYCGHTTENPEVCPSCGSKYIRYFGGGTQRVEEEIKTMFPEASVLRMDVDTTGGKFAHEKILEKFENENVDILIGTQMVAKGLDFENVTLVGVISADVMLNIDDYRAGERSFSVLEQVVGRAGRAKKPGRAIVQTYSPEHMALEFMKEHDYKSFYQAEIMMRKAMRYPPFCSMILIMFSASSDAMAKKTAGFFVKNIGKIRDLPQKINVLGPIPAAVSKIKNKYRWQLVIKCENTEELNVILNDARDACAKNGAYAYTSIVIDKNPNGFI